MKQGPFPKSGTIKVGDLRAQPGEYITAVSRCGQSFTITKLGNPVARLVPVEKATETVIESDGTIRGPVPLTFRQNLGG